MDLKQLQDAHSRKRTIQHKNGGIYVILGFGKMKADGEWYDSCTYMDVKTKDSFTRSVFGFKNFHVREK